MRIAQVTPVYPPYHGGIGVVAHEYTKRLTALGHTVEVFTPAWKIGNAGFLSSVRRLKAFDIVHLHYPFYGGAEQVAFSPLPVPIVLTFHMEAMAKGLNGKVFGLHRRLIQPMVLKRADRILVSSLDYLRSSSAGRWADDAKTVELPLGVDIERFRMGSGAECGIESAGFDKKTPKFHIQRLTPSGAPVLLFVGGLDSAHAFKGLPVLLAALPFVKNPFHLVVVGDGNLRASFEATAQTLECRHNVHFVGNVSDEELPNFYRQAGIHVFPSTSRAEAFGLVALEAAASGIPTIASDLPGVRTVVRHGETGLLVPPNDALALAAAIDRLLSNCEEREKLGVAARARAVNEYSWDRIMDRLVRVYESV